jgi:putative ABC transport system substrate-binding protein
MKHLAVTLLALALLAAPLAAEAQPSGRVYRVGRLLSGVPDPASFDAFKQGLRELGWAVDQNLLVKTRSAEGSLQRLPALAAELVRLKVDVIEAVGDAAIEAARKATSSIPIVMAVATDAVGRGFVASLARPGGNLTGISAFLPELAGKRIQLLQETLPNVRRVGVVSTSNSFHRSELGRIEAASRSLGLDVRAVEVTGPDNLAGAVGRLATAGVRLRTGFSNITRLVTNETA